jgi:ABC-type sugar transport system ATPase subunit
MNSQPPLNWTGMLLMAALLRMDYEISRPIPDSRKDAALLPTLNIGENSPEQEWPSLLPWQRKASEKAVENYAAVQERKWHRWNEAMFEPNGGKQQKKKPSGESV